MATQTLTLTTLGQLTQSGGNTSWSIGFSGGFVRALSPSYSSGASTVNMASLFSASYGFSIPAGSVINGIELRIAGSLPIGGGSFGNNTPFLSTISLTGSATRNFDFPINAGYTNYIFGGATDLWGRSWTAADINSSGFGAKVLHRATNANIDVGLRDYQITVYYTPYTTTDRDQLGDAMVRATIDKDQLGDAQIRATLEQDQVGDARIQATFGQDQIGNADIANFSSQDQLGDASIYNFVDREQLGDAVIVYGADRDQIGDAFILALYRERPRTGAVVRQMAIKPPPFTSEIKPDLRVPEPRPRATIERRQPGALEDPDSPLVDDLVALVDDPFALVGRLIHAGGATMPGIDNGAKMKTNISTAKSKGPVWQNSPRASQLSPTSTQPPRSPTRITGPGTIRSTPSLRQWQPSSVRIYRPTRRP